MRRRRGPSWTSIGSLCLTDDQQWAIDIARELCPSHPYEAIVGPRLLASAGSMRADDTSAFRIAGMVAACCCYQFDRSILHGGLLTRLVSSGVFAGAPNPRHSRVSSTWSQPAPRADDPECARRDGNACERLSCEVLDHR